MAMNPLQALASMLLVLAIAPAAGAQATKPAAPRVVFLLDASGTMIETLGVAKYELKLAIQDMPDGGQFGIVTNSNNGKLTQGFKKTLATADDKQAAYQFIGSVKPTGPDGDLKEAVALIKPLKPEVVWFLTDGQYTKPDVILSALKSAAKRDGYRVNIVILNDGKLPAGINEAAEETGGRCFDFDPKGSVIRPIKPMVDKARPAKPELVKPGQPADDKPEAQKESAPATKPLKRDPTKSIFWEL